MKATETCWCLKLGAAAYEKNGQAGNIRDSLKSIDREILISRSEYVYE